MRVPSPSMVVALVALFVALGGAGVAATGDNFILGQTNTASSQSTLNAPVAGGKALQVINTDNTNAASTALGLVAAAGHPPMTVNTSTKVANLNADSLDGVDSTKFLRSSIPLSLTGGSPSGVINGTNTGGGNGLQGVTGGSAASGVYGQNNSGGYGVFGRSNQDFGIGVAGEALGNSAHAVSALTSGNGSAMIASNQGSGTALELHTAGAAPMAVDSSAKVDNLNADQVDGLDSTQLVRGDGRILSNRIISTTQNDHILQLPGFGDFNVVSCDHTNARFQWSSGGPNAYVTWWDDFNATDSSEGIFNIVTSNLRPHHFVHVMLARDVGANTSMATVTLMTRAVDCVFAAQAVVQPG